MERLVAFEQMLADIQKQADYEREQMDILQGRSFLLLMSVPNAAERMKTTFLSIDTKKIREVSDKMDISYKKLTECELDTFRNANRTAA